MSKSLGNVMFPRLQRMKVKLLKYQIVLKYLLGKFMYSRSKKKKKHLFISIQIIIQK